MKPPQEETVAKISLTRRGAAVPHGACVDVHVRRAAPIPELAAHLGDVIGDRVLRDLGVSPEAIRAYRRRFPNVLRGLRPAVRH